MPGNKTPSELLKEELSLAQTNSKIRKNSHLISLRPLQIGERTLNTLDDLSECACADGFNRHTSKRRQDLEERVVTHARHTFPLDKPKKLNYLSLGAGGLLQDYLICGYLLLAGYSLNIYLVERQSYTSLELKSALARFVFLLEGHACSMGLTCSVQAVGSMSDFTKAHPDEKIQLAVAIDYDAFLQYQAFTDLLLVHQYLDAEGFLYLAWGQYTYAFRKGYCIYDQYFGFDLMGLKPFRDRAEYQIALCLPALIEEAFQMQDVVTKETSLPKYCTNEILKFAALFPNPAEIKKNIAQNNGMYKPKNKLQF